jgi:hypothetical protein
VSKGDEGEHWLFHTMEILLDKFVDRVFLLFHFVVVVIDNTPLNEHINELRITIRQNNIRNSSLLNLLILLRTLTLEKGWQEPDLLLDLVLEILLEINLVLKLKPLWLKQFNLHIFLILPGNPDGMRDLDLHGPIGRRHRINIPQFIIQNRCHFEIVDARNVEKTNYYTGHGHIHLDKSVAFQPIWNVALILNVDLVVRLNARLCKLAQI